MENGKWKVETSRRLGMCAKAVILSIVLSIGLLAGFIAGCDMVRRYEPVSETRLLLHTYCTITVYASNAQPLLKEALDLCAEYEALFSMTAEGSDVWRINNAGGAPVTVAPQTAELVRMGLEYCEMSGGKFDISIGRVSRLWNFGSNTSVPSDEALSAAILTVDYTQIVVDGDTVQLRNPEAWIDLGAIAKGYIADKLADFFIERGVTGAVVDLGGDVAIVGKKPDGNPWRLGVRKPFSERGELLGVIETGEATVVTSGVYERQFEENGVLYHHILDPETGFPMQTDVVSVTVVAESSTAGDALSTIALLVGSDIAPYLLGRAPGFIGAVLLLDNGEMIIVGDVTFVPLD